VSKLASNKQWMEVLCVVKQSTYTTTVIVAILAIVVIAGAAMFAGSGQMATTGDTTKTDPDTGEQRTLEGCNQKPDLTVLGVDEFSKSTQIPGQGYLKEDGDPATSVSGSNTVNANEELNGLWVNESWFCGPEPMSLDCGDSEDLYSYCIENGSATVKVKDLTQDEFVGVDNNVTLTANDDASLEVQYDGQSENANMPFGGCIIVEVPNTVTEVSLTGEGVSEGCDYQTNSYTTSSTSNSMYAFQVPKGYDADTGTILSHNLEIASGDSDPSGTAKVSFLPAAYYVSEAGNFELDVEKAADGSNTRTFGSTLSKTFGIL